MKKEQAKEHIRTTFREGESLVGFFISMQRMKFWLLILLGPLIALTMRHYYVAVSDKGVHFYRLTMLGKFSDNHDFFSYAEITSIRIKKGFIQRPLHFQFSNGRTLKLRAQLKGVKSVAKLDAMTQQYLAEHIKPA
ncbi:MAG: hypothetical protein JKX84_09300 [Flavobacteriales bacterium]|nr:hypothetical protein [Flavobacteriales bacterium]